MIDLRHNPRYVNWARFNGRTPNDQFEQDQKDWPGGVMVGFTQWNMDRLRDASREIPDSFYLGGLIHHAVYDEWLTKWVDERTDK